MDVFEFLTNSSDLNIAQNLLNNTVYTQNHYGLITYAMDTFEVFDFDNSTQMGNTDMSLYYDIIDTAMADSVFTADFTATVDGLLAALDYFESNDVTQIDNHDRYVVLLTDGDPNYPVVKPFPCSFFYTLDDDFVTDDISFYGGLIGGEFDTAYDNLECFTTPPNVGLLQSISNYSALTQENFLSKLTNNACPLTDSPSLLFSVFFRFEL